jgi:hypothetical protein
MHVADDVERPGLALLVVPERLARDRRRIDSSMERITVT